MGDVAVLAGTDMDLGGASVPVESFAFRIPHDAVPAIREAVRDPLLVIPVQDDAPDIAALASRTADAWHPWHQSAEHRTDVGRILARLLRDSLATLGLESLLTELDAARGARGGYHDDADQP